MSEPPDFRLEQSELRGEDEYTEFGYEDLEYYVDVRGTFDKLPLCPDDESLAADRHLPAEPAVVVGGPNGTRQLIESPSLAEVQAAIAAVS